MEEKKLDQIINYINHIEEKSSIEVQISNIEKELELLKSEYTNYYKNPQSHKTIYHLQNLILFSGHVICNLIWLLPFLKEKKEIIYPLIGTFINIYFPYLYYLSVTAEKKENIKITKENKQNRKNLKQQIKQIQDLLTYTKALILVNSLGDKDNIEGKKLYKNLETSDLQELNLYMKYKDMIKDYDNNMSEKEDQQIKTLKNLY